jgi:hypothetical protein
VKGAAAVGVGVCVVQVGRETSSGIHVPGLLALATASAARSTVSFIILYLERLRLRLRLRSTPNKYR